MIQLGMNQNALPLIMCFAKTTKFEGYNTDYAYNDYTQKPEYRLDYLVSYKTKMQGGWTWDQKMSKTPPKKK